MKKIVAALVMFLLIGAGVITVLGTQCDIKILDESNSDLVYVKIFEQPPNFDRNHGSDVNFGTHPKMYENIWDINSDVIKVTWWGVTLNVDENTSGWINGTPEGMNFFIFFYDDSEEQSNAPPDELIRSFDFSAEDIEVTHTGEYFYPKKYVGKHELIKFDCLLSSPVSLSDGNGWISIQSHDDTENDLFLWMTGSSGDNFSYQENGLKLLYYDTALCLYRADQSPNAPTITGNSTGKPETEYTYTFVSTDPENDEILYFIDWGDNSSEETIPYQSGVEISAKHTWSEQGNFTIKAKAKDTYGAESDWAILNVNVTKSKVKTFDSFFLRFLENYPILYQLLQRLQSQ